MPSCVNQRTALSFFLLLPFLTGLVLADSADESSKAAVAELEAYLAQDASH